MGFKKLPSGRETLGRPDERQGLQESHQNKYWWRHGKKRNNNQNKKQCHSSHRDHIDSICHISKRAFEKPKDWREEQDLASAVSQPSLI